MKSVTLTFSDERGKICEMSIVAEEHDYNKVLMQQVFNKFILKDGVKLDIEENE